MRETRNPTDRLHELVDRRLSPALRAVGFRRRSIVFERDRGEVRSLVEVELAPWSTPDKVCFTLAWGVSVPALDEVLGGGAGQVPGAGACEIHGRLGESDLRLDARWFTLGSPPVPGMHRIVDALTTRSVLWSMETEVLPMLDRFPSIAEVQTHLVEGLVRGRGAADDGELRRIRAIAELSLLLCDRPNASRWLDYLEARSSVAIAPDVVAERLAALRQRCAS